MGAADHPEAGDEFADVTASSSQTPRPDRSHNRDTLSSEAMTEMLRDLQDSMLALDERLLTLESAQGEAAHDTSRLALGVVDMGDALTRRVRALEHRTQDPPAIVVRREPATPIKRAPRPPPPQHRLVWTTALVFVLALVLGAFWMLAAESLDHATLAAALKPPVVATPPPAPQPAPTPAVVDARPIAPPPASHPASHTVTTFHHPTFVRRTSGHTYPASSSTPSPTGFGHYGPSPSTPPPASAPSPPPS